jgi:nitrous oxide reductase accessory protein NosL
MRLANGSKAVLAAAALAAALAGCQQATETSNTTATNANGNATVNINGSNANMTTSTVTTNTGQTIEAREPEKYSATMVATLATQGQQQAKGQAEIKVARNGADRRYAVTLPVVGELVFLDKADKRYVIMHGRKQYAELTQEMTGVNMDQMRSMTPGQLVAFVTSQKGVERVGEETFNGRPAYKYRVAGRTQTQTTAGQVQGESFIYIDKDTGLPLRIEGFGQSSGNVQGVTGGNVVVETRELKTDVNPADFEIPQGYKQLSPEEVRAQVAQLGQLLQGVMAFINAQQAAGGGAAAPAASPSATPAR